jgi:hypothetical protein
MSDIFDNVSSAMKRGQAIFRGQTIRNMLSEAKNQAARIAQLEEELARKSAEATAFFDDAVAVRRELSGKTAELAALRERERWIPVTEKEPPLKVDVEIVESELGIMIAHRHGSFSMYTGYKPNGEGGIICEATHWRPMPQPPEAQP